MELKNPIIASSSTFTDNVESIRDLEQAGVSAVVLRSIFEEEISLEMEHEIKEAIKEGFDEGLFDYYDAKIKQDNISDYIKLIKDAKSAIASTLYRNGMEVVEKMLQDLEAWMSRKGYEKLDDFRGKLSYSKAINPAVYTRMQFLKHFGTK
jgi:hypothetical protein